MKLSRITCAWWVQPLRADGWERAQGVGAHRFYIRVSLTSKYALNGTITVSQSSWHARKVHTTIPHLLVTDEVGLCWAVQWRKACQYAASGTAFISEQIVLPCENMEFRTFYSRDLDLDPTIFKTNLTRWRVKVYSQTKRNFPHQACQKLSYCKQTDVETDRQMPQNIIMLLRGW